MFFWKSLSRAGLFCIINDPIFRSYKGIHCKNVVEITLIYFNSLRPLLNGLFTETQNSENNHKSLIVLKLFKDPEKEVKPLRFL